MEAEEIHDFRARFRIVPVTERLSAFARSTCSVLKTPSTALVLFTSSDDSVNLATDILFFAFLDALRNSSLLAV